MAISINKKPASTKLATKTDNGTAKYLKISTGIMAALSSADISLVFANNKALFHIGGKVLDTYSFNQSTFNMLLAQELMTQGREFIRKKLEAIAIDVLAEQGHDVKGLGKKVSKLKPDKTVSPSPETSETYGLGEPPEPMPEGEANTTVTTGVVAPSTVSDTAASSSLSDTPVKLADATKLLQPVCGTGANTKYHVVAVSESLKIACRLKNNNLSVRAAGDIQAYKSLLQDAGFALKSEGHASLHLDVTQDPVLQRKTMGAVLFALNFSFSEIYTKIDKLHGMGS